MKVTQHARQRIAERQLSLDDVMSIVRNPRMKWPDPDFPDRQRLSDGETLVVVVRRRPPPKADQLVTVFGWDLMEEN